MLFTVFKHGTLLSLLLAQAPVACAQAAMPSTLIEPLFGLKIAPEKAQLKQLAEPVRKLCREIADTKQLTARMWIFARANDTEASYYLVGGHIQRKHPGRGESTFRLDDRGGIYRIENGGCTGIGPVREVFAVRPADEVPLPVLQRLATEMAITLQRAVGGSDALKQALARKRIDASALSPELQEAFKPYLGSD